MSVTDRYLAGAPEESRWPAFRLGRIWQTFGPLLSLIILSLLIWSQ